MDIGTAINRIAERTYDGRELMGQTLRQRRTEYTDVYGIPYRSELESDKTFSYHIMISPDLEYYERFQFKLYVETAEEGASIDPDQFTLKMTDTETYDEVKASLGQDPYQWIDLTDYLREQQDEWPDSTGYFPSEPIGSSDLRDFYDVLDACGLIELEDQEREKSEEITIPDEERRKTILLTPGNKLIQIKSPTKCDVTLNLVLKYSTINR